MEKLSTKQLGILFACFSLLGLSAPASASLCGVTISTTWTPNVIVSPGFSDSSFSACDTSSTADGDYRSFYELTVEAMDDDTFALTGVIGDVSGMVNLPAYTLELDGIEWFGMDGDIEQVIDNSDFWSVDSFDANTIILSFPTTSFNCQSPPCSYDLGTIDVVAHSVVPVPAAVWLFGSGLLGLIGIARRKV